MVMSAEPLRQVRDHFSEVVDRGEHHHEMTSAEGRAVFTRRGHDGVRHAEIRSYSRR